MERILTMLLALGIASAPAFVAGVSVIAPAVTTTATAGASATTTNSTKTGAQTTTRAATTNATTSTTTVAAVTTGNGAPSGTHYNLNIIGVSKDKTAPMTGNDGHRIFVQLNGGDSATDLDRKVFFRDLNRVNKIFLQKAPAGESFLVLDANATDSTGALFQLPADVSTTWTVWARALGKPGGHANMTTCATELVPDATGVLVPEVICSLSTNTLSLERTKGKATFQNVSADLLFITITVDPIADAALALCLGKTGDVQLALFDPCLENFFWNYENHGLKLLQLRFYPKA